MALVLSKTCKISLFCTWFPHRLESVDHARPWFCPKLVRFLFCTWFPHRLESEDHARPWFCPKLKIFLMYLFYFSTISPFTRARKVGLRLEAPRDARALSTARRSP